MLRTPVEIEDTEGDVYRTERPRANELPEFVGSPVAQVIRQSLAQMRGYIQIPGLELHRMLTQIYGPSAWKGPAPPSSKESEDPNLPPEGKKKKEAKPWLLEYTDNPKPWSLEFRNVSFHYPSYVLFELILFSLPFFVEINNKTKDTRWTNPSPIDTNCHGKRTSPTSSLCLKNGPRKSMLARSSCYWAAMARARVPSCTWSLNCTGQSRAKSSLMDKTLHR